MPLKPFPWPWPATLVPFLQFFTWINVRNYNITRTRKCITSDEHNTFRKQN
jgi:hypothetical protein